MIEEGSEGGCLVLLMTAVCRSRSVGVSSSKGRGRGCRLEILGVGWLACSGFAWSVREKFAKTYFSFKAPEHGSQVVCGT